MPAKGSENFPTVHAKHGLIEIKVRDLAQVFNSMDPSPFNEKDLDDDAVDFIVGWAREHHHKAPLRLIVHLTQKPVDPNPEELLRTAVSNFFEHRAAMTWRDLGALMRQGEASLIIGLLFLAACLGGGDLLLLWHPTPWTKIIKEGLTIVGWVAMWRPLQIYLYDWWPLRNRAKLFQRLARMRVLVKMPKEAGTTAEHTPTATAHGEHLSRPAPQGIPVTPQPTG